MSSCCCLLFRETHTLTWTPAREACSFRVCSLLSLRYWLTSGCFGDGSSPGGNILPPNRSNNMTGPMVQDPGSFRDPANIVFSVNGSLDRAVFRAIFAPGVQDYVSAKDKGVYTRLSQAGMLLPMRRRIRRPRHPRGLSTVCDTTPAHDQLSVGMVLFDAQGRRPSPPRRDGNPSSAGLLAEGRERHQRAIRRAGLASHRHALHRPQKKGHPWIAYRQFCRIFSPPSPLPPTETSARSHSGANTWTATPSTLQRA